MVGDRQEGSLDRWYFINLRSRYFKALQHFFVLLAVVMHLHPTTNDCLNFPHRRRMKLKNRPRDHHHRHCSTRNNRSIRLDQLQILDVHPRHLWASSYDFATKARLLRLIIAELIANVRDYRSASLYSPLSFAVVTLANCWHLAWMGAPTCLLWRRWNSCRCNSRMQQRIYSPLRWWHRWVWQSSDLQWILGSHAEYFRSRHNSRYIPQARMARKRTYSLPWELKEISRPIKWWTRVPPPHWLLEFRDHLRLKMCRTYQR